MTDDRRKTFLVVMVATLLLPVPAWCGEGDLSDQEIFAATQPLPPRSESESDKIAAQALIAQGRVWQGEGKSLEAMRAYQRAWRYDPTQVGLLTQIAELAFEQDRRHEAMTYAVLAAEHLPSEKTSLRQAALYLASQQELGRARTLAHLASIRFPLEEIKDPSLLAKAIREEFACAKLYFENGAFPQVTTRLVSIQNALQRVGPLPPKEREQDFYKQPALVPRLAFDVALAQKSKAKGEVALQQLRQMDGDSLETILREIQFAQVFGNGKADAALAKRWEDTIRARMKQEMDRELQESVMELLLKRKEWQLLRAWHGDSKVPLEQQAKNVPVRRRYSLYGAFITEDPEWFLAELSVICRGEEGFREYREELLEAKKRSAFWAELPKSIDEKAADSLFQLLGLTRAQFFVDDKESAQLGWSKIVNQEGDEAFANALFLWGKEALFLHQLDTAQMLLEMVQAEQKLQTRSAEVESTLAELCQLQRKLEEAITHGQKAIELEPKDYRYQETLTKIYARQWEWGKVLETTQQMDKLFSEGERSPEENKAWVTMKLATARAHNALANEAEAEAIYEKLLDAEPSNSDVQHAAALYWFKKRKAYAERLYKNAISDNPRNAAYFSGFTLFRDNDQLDGTRYLYLFSKRIELPDANGSAWNEWGNYWATQSDKIFAIKMWEKASALHVYVGEHADAEKIQRKIKRFQKK